MGLGVEHLEDGVRVRGRGRGRAPCRWSKG